MGHKPTPLYPKSLDISSITGNLGAIDIKRPFGSSSSLFRPSGSAETIEPAGFAVFGVVVVDLQGFLRYGWSTTLKLGDPLGRGLGVCEG